MKIFISVDIEGTCGACHWDEATLGKTEYEKQRKIMNEETLTAVKAINDKVDAEIVIKDAHDSGRNLDITVFPENCTIIRGWDEGPLSMMQGINNSFDASIFIGYHSAAGTGGSPLAHTMNYKKYSYIKINDQIASEFLLNYYTSLYYNVPVIFLSGDKLLCNHVKTVDENIKTVCTFEGKGDSAITNTPNFVNKSIYKQVQLALNEINSPLNELPKHFEVEMCYMNHTSAYRASFYKGMTKQNPTTLHYSTDDFMEFLIMFMFV